MAFAIGTLVAFAIGTLVVAEAAAMLMRPDHAFHAQELGIAVGAILGGAGPFIGGFASYWWLDSVNAKNIAQAQAMSENK